MNRTLIVLTGLLGLCLVGTFSSANLLEDGGFELADPESLISNSNWVATANMPDGVDLASQFQFAPWASNPLGQPGTGWWLRAFEGNQNAGVDPLAQSEISQDVAAGPGSYNLSFFLRHETNFTAGEAFVELSALQGGGQLAAATFDLLDTSNDGAYNQYSIDGFLAPDGTETLRVRAVMVDGMDAGMNPQSMMLDDFDLVPEPVAASLLWIAGVGLCLARRRP